MTIAVVACRRIRVASGRATAPLPPLLMLPLLRFFNHVGSVPLITPSPFSSSPTCFHQYSSRRRSVRPAAPLSQSVLPPTDSEPNHSPSRPLALSLARSPITEALYDDIKRAPKNSRGQRRRRRWRRWHRNGALRIEKKGVKQDASSSFLIVDPPPSRPHVNSANSLLYRKANSGSVVIVSE